MPKTVNEIQQTSTNKCSTQQHVKGKQDLYCTTNKQTLHFKNINIENIKEGNIVQQD